jgi:hypothetical protein
MAHEIHWIKGNRVLYVNYQGYQTPDTLLDCLDEQANFMDTATQPVVVLINWLEVSGSATGTLTSQNGHRAYSHPNAARAVLVGFDRQATFENEVTAVNTRKTSHTRYFATMEEAMDYMRPMLEEDQGVNN